MMKQVVDHIVVALMPSRNSFQVLVFCSVHLEAYFVAKSLHISCAGCSGMDRAVYDSLQRRFSSFFSLARSLVYQRRVCGEGFVIGTCCEMVSCSALVK